MTSGSNSLSLSLAGRFLRRLLSQRLCDGSLLLVATASSCGSLAVALRSFVLLLGSSAFAVDDY